MQNKVVFPTMARADIAVIAISTMDDPFSPWSVLIRKKMPNGDSLFRVVEFTFVCRECRAEGIEDQCKHKQGDVPYWLSVDQISKLRVLLEDDFEALMREVMGFQADTSTSDAFLPKNVNRLRRMPLTRPDVTFDRFYTVVDPCGKGTSEYSIVSFGYHQGRFYIVGIDSFRFKGSFPTFAALRDHIAGVRTIPGFEMAQAYIVVENNFGNDTDMHWFMAQQNGLQNFEFHVNERGQLGFHTSNTTKRTMAYGTNDLLERECISFHQGLVTARGASPDHMRRTFIQQASGYKRRVKPGRTADDLPIEFFSGKMGGGKDDVIVAAQIGFNVCASIEREKMAEEAAKKGSSAAA